MMKLKKPIKKTALSPKKEKPINSEVMYWLYLVVALFFIPASFFNQNYAATGLWMIATIAIIIGIVAEIVAEKKIGKVNSIGYSQALLGILFTLPFILSSSIDTDISFFDINKNNGYVWIVGVSFLIGLRAFFKTEKIITFYRVPPQTSLPIPVFSDPHNPANPNSLLNPANPASYLYKNR